MMSQLYKLVRKETENFDRYQLGQLKIIGFKDFKHSDCIVKDHFSYFEWVFQKNKIPVIKVEGIEDNKKVRSFFPKSKNIHLFINQKTCYSFNWHRDNINVYLLVLKGKKTVYLGSRRINLKAGQSIVIPKGKLHKVFSSKNTWALSVGF